MSIYITSLLDEHSLIAVQDSLSKPSLFADGKATAGGTAENVKSNLQADKDAPEVIAAQKLIEKLLLANPLIKKSVYPDCLAKIMFSRYQAGMSYGEHVDEAIINNVRTDIAFTLFLSDPSRYEGGELEISKPDGHDSIKLPAGGLYLYSADSIHKVNPVTSGSRLAAVGWLQSKVRLAPHRQILSDINQALRLLPDSESNKTARLRFLKVKNNLERAWCD
ncbi:MAG: Fe2+-dependent dioxygenase [Arenicella sp.]|nr:Fe2+-dependent dioxygenase [Arenicella sp.]